MKSYLHYLFISLCWISFFTYFGVRFVANLNDGDTFTTIWISFVMGCGIALLASYLRDLAES